MDRLGWRASLGERTRLRDRPGTILLAVLWRSALLAGLWWVLTEGRIDAWGVGLVSVMVALAASMILLLPGKNWISPLGLAGFLGFFLVQSVRGGIQVAGMALRPRLDLCPGVLDITLYLLNGAGRVFLANTLSLLPGTLSLGLEGAHLRLHVLDKHRSIEAEVRVAERHVARMFGLRLAA